MNDYLHMLSISKVSLAARYLLKRSCCWYMEKTGQVGISLKKCAGEHTELPGYARPHLCDGYEVYVTFLLKYQSR